MPIVPVSEFHPHTGAYWKGYIDACDGRPKAPPTDQGWSERSIRDYNEGYDAAIAEIEAEQPRT